MNKVTSVQKGVGCVLFTVNPVQGTSTLIDIHCVYETLITIVSLGI